ncbi:transcriptional regulator [Kibdelosporangium aridum]|uniref:transcriptional regulator n=1 Tax=Kibdelosporangium aridum TaxID=2030 RepID=UPI0035EE33FE
MSLVSGWTGKTAGALQSALRLSNEAFAQHLGIGVRTVAAWHKKPTLRPQSEMQRILDTALEQAPPAVQARFAELSYKTSSTPDDRLSADPNITSALDWLDHHAGWQPGTSRHEVAARVQHVDPHELELRGRKRGRVDQQQIARALAEYYGNPSGLYGAGNGVTTSILTRPDWLDLACPLIASNDRLKLTSAAKPAVSLDDEAAGQAAQRLAETLALGIRMVDMPIYQLLSTDIHRGEIGGTVGVSTFVHYALTMDLLEGEFVDALTTGTTTHPLRDRYLPDLDSILNLSDRLCAGGTLALTAIARPADPYRGPADYVLLVQERSGHVVNAARRLAPIPKGFHQPLTDYRADAQIGATLRREIEEELFGRDDVDNTVGEQRFADPMHPSRLSEPMRWLMSDLSRLRMECTGFGLNLVSGNYEFAGLIAIDDEEFWTRYGGMIEANWEASTLRQYSTLDSDQITHLIQDVAWSNEGLFALLQGLRRLRELGGSRVNLPEIEWETT